MPVTGLTDLPIGLTVSPINPFSTGVVASFPFSGTVTLPTGSSGTRWRFRVRVGDSGVSGYYGNQYGFSAPVNCTGKLLFFWIAWGNFSSSQTNELRLAVGSSATDWKRWILFPQSFSLFGPQANNYFGCVLDLNSPADAEAGDLNPAAVDRIELSVYHNGTSDTPQYRIGSAHLADLTWTGGTDLAPGSLADFASFFSSQFLGPIYRHPIRQNGIFFDADLPRLNIGDGTTQTFFRANIGGLAFSASDTTADNAYIQTTDDSRRLTVRDAAGGETSLKGQLISSPDGWTLETAAGASLSLEGCILNNLDSLVLASPLTARQTQISASVQIPAADFRLLTGSVGESDNAIAYLYESGDVAPTGLNIGAGQTAQVSCAPGDDLSDCELDFEAGAILALSPTATGASAIDLSGMTASGTLTLDNLTAFEVTVTVAPGQATNAVGGVVTGTTGGGSINVISPQVAFTAPNLPDGAHYLLRYADGDEAELEIGTISGGSGLSYTLPPADNRLIRLLAIHVTSSPLYASRLLNFVFRNTGVSVATEAGLEEFTLYAELGRDGLDVSITSKFVLDNPNLQIDANDVDGILSATEAHAFAWGQMQLNPAALRLGYVPIEAFTRVGFIVRASWKVENQSLTTPLLITDGYYIDEAGQPYNPCAPAVDGKQSTSVQFEPSHTVSISGSGGGGLGPEDAARLERIENQLMADYFKGENRFQKFLSGTSTVIYDKDVVLDPDGFRVTEHTG